MLRAAFLPALLLTAAGAASPAFAQNAQNAACQSMLELSWSDIVRAPVMDRPDYMLGMVDEQDADESATDSDDPETPEDPANALLSTLASICADAPEQLLDISLLHAQRALDARDFETALKVLERVQPERDSKVLSGYHRALAAAHFGIGWRNSDFTDYHRVRDAMLARNREGLVRQGIAPEATIEVAGHAIEAFRLPPRVSDARTALGGPLPAIPEGQAPGWFLVVAMADGSVQSILAEPNQWAPEGQFPELDLSSTSCSSSGGWIDAGELRFDGELVFADIAKILETHFKEQTRADRRMRGIDAFCPNFAKMLPGLGGEYSYIGIEYRDASAPYTEADILASLQSEDDEIRSWASDYVLDHPSLIEPIYLAFAITNLIQRGDMERATFWYYIWQTRTRPWMPSMADSAALRSALSSTIGVEVNTWVASDFAALRQLYVKSIRYELRFPLYDRRPEGYSKERWTELVDQAREQNSEEAILAMLDALSAEEFAATRRENGLYVGPWIEPGRPLKPEWIVGADEK